MRYLILLILNVPIILIAIVGGVTKYKLGKTSKNRFILQLIFWLIALIIIICAFPVYNSLLGRPMFDAGDLSLIDIFQTTAIIVLLYYINNQRQLAETTERRLRDLHQELSIRLSNDSKN